MSWRSCDTIALKRDGHVVACPGNFYGACNIPVFIEGVTYNRDTTVHAHTVLLEGDDHVGSLRRQL